MGTSSDFEAVVNFPQRTEQLLKHPWLRQEAVECVVSAAVCAVESAPSGKALQPSCFGFGGSVEVLPGRLVIVVAREARRLVLQYCA